MSAGKISTRPPSSRSTAETKRLSPRQLARSDRALRSEPTVIVVRFAQLPAPLHREMSSAGRAPAANPKRLSTRIKYHLNVWDTGVLGVVMDERTRDAPAGHSPARARPSSRRCAGPGRPLRRRRSTSSGRTCAAGVTTGAPSTGSGRGLFQCGDPRRGAPRRSGFHGYKHATWHSVNHVRHPRRARRRQSASPRATSSTSMRHAHPPTAWHGDHQPGCSRWASPRSRQVG